MKDPEELLILREIPYTLLIFLVKHKALKKFINNTHKYYRHWDIEISKIIVKLHSTHAINLCFRWANTPEGSDYWYDLYKLYIKKYEK